MSEVSVNVLLIDDEVISHVVNTMVLHRIPCIGNVFDVRTARQAISFLEDRLKKGDPLPDLIYLDINMPEINGFEFIELVHAHPCIDYTQLTIVILSSSLHPADMKRANAMGISHFIVKPLREVDILQSIKLVEQEK